MVVLLSIFAPNSKEYSMEEETEVFEIVEMPEWKSKLLNGLAWLLGLKGEKVYLITISDNNE
jgi:hypothetical protein